VWQDKANTTIIKTEYPAEYSKESDSLTIVQTAEGYFLDMGKLGGHPYCGAGAELPRAVFISKASKRCKVRMR
jgi:hypothetical protein